MSETTEALAWAAVTTPSLDAEGSLAVLADALLEEGTIQPPWKPSSKRMNRRQRRRTAERAHRNLLLQAWEWATAATETPLSKVQRAMEMISFMPRRDPIIMSPDSYRQLQDLLNNGLITTDQARSHMGIDVIADPNVAPGTIFGLNRSDMVDAFTYAWPRQGKAEK